MSTGPSPVDVLGDLPPLQWDVLVRGVRRAVDQLAASEVPAALRPFSRWHPDALRDAARARDALARALVSDARFRAEVAEAVADDDRRALATTLDPLSLRRELGSDEAVALLAVTARWSDLATLAAQLADERSAAGRATSETAPEDAPGPTVNGLQEQVRALRRTLQEAERREADLRRSVQRLTRERDDAQAEAARGRIDYQELVERRDRERADQRERLARLRRRVRLAESRAGASEARRAEIISELAALSQRLQAPLPSATASSPPRDAEGDAVGVPHRVRPAVPGRPCRLPAGVDPNSSTAVTSLLQVAGLRLLIDGYNVTRDARAVPDTGLEQQRAWLVRLVGGVVARFDVRPTLVFDGSADVEGAAPRARGVIVRFAVDETADELLVALLDGLPADEPVLVVTSDREICDAATIRDANSVSAAAFLEAVAP